MTNQELTRLLRTKGYKRVTLETDNGEPKHIIPIAVDCISMPRKTSLSTLCPHRKVWDWDGLPYAQPKTGQVSRQERIVPDCFSRVCCHSCKGKQAGKR